MAPASYAAFSLGSVGSVPVSGMDVEPAFFPRGVVGFFDGFLPPFLAVVFFAAGFLAAGFFAPFFAVLAAGFLPAAFLPLPAVVGVAGVAAVTCSGITGVGGVAGFLPPRL